MKKLNVLLLCFLSSNLIINNSTMSPHTHTQPHAGTTAVFAAKTKATPSLEDQMEHIIRTAPGNLDTFIKKHNLSSFQCANLIDTCLTNLAKKNQLTSLCASVFRQILLLLSAPQRPPHIIPYLTFHTAGTGSGKLQRVDIERLCSFLIPTEAEQFLGKSTQSFVDFMKKASIIPHYHAFFENHRHTVRIPVQEAMCQETTIKETLTRFIEYTAKEHKKGNIVICHGRSNQWNYYAEIAKQLWKIKGLKVPKYFLPLRYTLDEGATETEKNILRTTGITDATYTDYRMKLMFTTPVVCANGKGSNPVVYLRYNSDQSIKQGRYNGTLEQIFKDNGFEEELDALLTQWPDAFTTLEKLYKEAHQDDYGDLLALSFSPQDADALTYPTRSGGYLVPSTINNAPETRLSSIIDHIGDIDAWLEIAVILTDKVVHPEKATVTVRSFDPARTHRAAEYAAFLHHLRKIMAFVEKHYRNRIFDYQLYNA